MGLRVVSLFDGYAGAYEALELVGFDVDAYFASEVDKPAMQVASKNHPDIQYLGDVRYVNACLDGLDNIDLLIGGSPCQGFSFAGKQLNFEDPRSKLFFEFVRLRDEIQPKYFLLENVFMKKEYQDVISRYLGVEPIEINSNLVSAQNRRRLYWTNIPGVKAPKDRGILLKHIVHESTNETPQDAKPRVIRNLKMDDTKASALCASMWKGPQANGMTNVFEKTQECVVPYDDNGFLKADSIGVLKNHGNYREKSDKSNCIDANYWKGEDNHAQRTQIIEWLNQYIVPFDKTLKILDKETERGKIGYFKTNSQGNRVYTIHKKSVALCGEAGGRFAKTGGYLFGCITPDRIDKRQNGQRFNDGQKFYTLTAQDQHGILIEGYIRKLTPVECERLQTLPDNYTEGVSNTQRYKMLGNGFTVEVIAHILSYMLLEDM